MMFIDIETVPVVAGFKDLDARGQDLFCQRFNRQIQESYGNSPEVAWVEIAALHAEFARVLCVTVGISNQGQFRVKSLVNRQEADILKSLDKILHLNTVLCGHNIKTFDIPFLVRRYIINALSLPQPLNITGTKPWDIPHKDTLEMWKLGDYSSSISLDRLAWALGLPSPKQGINGADVGPLWYSEGNPDELPFDRDARVLKIITDYCAGDVITQANCYYRMTGQPIIQPTAIVYVE